jgi:hypothetical protein
MTHKHTHVCVLPVIVLSALNVAEAELTVTELALTNPVRTSQETHDVSATEPNRLMLCGETAVVYCENRTEHINTQCGHFSSYLTGDTLCLHYRAQPVNAVW